MTPSSERFSLLGGSAPWYRPYCDLLPNMRNAHFRPKDGYFLNQRGWWFYTRQAIGGPFPSKQVCIQACFRFIRTNT